MTPVFKILLAFIVCLITTFIFRFAIGKNRDLHFKRSPPKSFITLRTPIAMHFSLGYPITLKGYVLLALLLFILWMEISVIAYYF
jgi:hypothetical protein